VEVALGGLTATIARLRTLEEAGVAELARLPFCIRVLLENALRHCGRGIVTEDDIVALARWDPACADPREFAFMPSRVVLQDFTGVPCVVDLAAMRSAIVRLGGDPTVINPSVPVDLVIDHSVQVDYYGMESAYERNVQLEMARNAERYSLLRWAQSEFDNFRLVPPGTGIVHQVNLEYLASVVHLREDKGRLWAFPDSLIGTDSHTTMINGLGVIGWGVGGIEAEAVMLGQPYSMLIPEVVGVRLTGGLPRGTTATDLVLSITERLRRAGVVGRLVEFYGPGVDVLPLPDRATIANMSPEYGATMGFFPLDGETVRYLVQTARPPELVERVREYAQMQALWREPGDEPEYTRRIDFDLSEVRPSTAGPRRPQDRVPLGQMRENFLAALPALATAAGRADTTVCSADVCFVGAHDEALTRLEGEGGNPSPDVDYAAAAEASGASEQMPDGDGGADEEWVTLLDGAVVIAALTSCTNTSNPSVMLAAGLLAKKAVKRGLRVPLWVKTSLAPGSRVVTDYLERSGLLPYLEALNFQVVGYGCTTCIGNSGPLPEPVAAGIREGHLVTAAVLSGNRNFEARIHPLVRANYLASPPLVVAYALAGTVDIDLETDPLGRDNAGEPVFLADLWPSGEEIGQAMAAALGPEEFASRYASVFAGDEAWQCMPVPRGHLYLWDPASTYIREPPYFTDLPRQPGTLMDISGARILGIFGDSVTTDHISPAGTIPEEAPAGRYLIETGVSPSDFNTYGARRGNHEVMMRGTFANVRVRNQMVAREGGWTVHVPTGTEMTLYEAAMRYSGEGTPLIVIAGKEYGTGSSRDWAAKGPALMGVRAVIAESYERIHRSNLVGMGVLPLQFLPGTGANSLGLTGREQLTIEGVADGVAPGESLTVQVRAEDGKEWTFPVIARLDSPVDLLYYEHGGILPRVLRCFLDEEGL